MQYFHVTGLVLRWPCADDGDVKIRRKLTVLGIWVTRRGKRTESTKTARQRTKTSGFAALERTRRVIDHTEMWTRKCSARVLTNDNDNRPQSPSRPQFQNLRRGSPHSSGAVTWRSDNLTSPCPPPLPISSLPPSVCHFADWHGNRSMWRSGPSTPTPWPS